MGETYRATANFPRSELYGLTSQIRRCNASIGGNIPEGCSGSGSSWRGLSRFGEGSDRSQKDAHISASKDRRRPSRCQML